MMTIDDSGEIYKNEMRIKRRIGQAERILKPINQLFKIMEEDGIKPTLENLKKFLTGGTDFIKEELRNEAVRAVKPLKIKNPKVEESLINGAVTMLNSDYDRIRQRIHELKPDAGIEWDDLLVLKGEPMLSESFKKRIEQEFSVTLDTEKKQKFWDELKSLCDSFNRLEELAMEIGLPSLQEHLNPGKAVFMRIEERGFYIRITPNPGGFIEILEI